MVVDVVVVELVVVVVTCLWLCWFRLLWWLSCVVCYGGCGCVCGVPRILLPK